MKIIKASQLISSIIEEESGKIKISAVRVNKLCENMHSKNICCELTRYDFEELAYLYPDVMSVSSCEIVINPTVSFKSSIRTLYQFDDNLLGNSEIIKYWKETNG